jgi:hypothetical protein
VPLDKKGVSAGEILVPYRRFKTNRAVAATEWKARALTDINHADTTQVPGIPISNTNQTSALPAFDQH